MAATVVHTHRAPSMFCAPGYSQVFKAWTGFGGHGNTLDDVAPWPAGSQLRLAIMTPDRVPPWVIDIVKTAADKWTSGTGETLQIRCVSIGESPDIRISFRTDMPTFAYVGARATFYEQSQPTVNFNFGGWKDTQKAVYSHEYVTRLAYHLLGHAFGLPHAALGQYPVPWKAAELEKLCGTQYAQIVQSAKGSSRLTAADSIMRYDIPGTLTTVGKNMLTGGRQLDNEAAALLRSLYPPVPEAHSFGVYASQLSGFQPGWTIGTTMGKGSFNTAQTSNIITGIFYIDMGLNGNFRLNSGPSNIRTGSGYTIELGSWWDTHLIQAGCNVLSFHESDQRVQTGRIEYNQLSGGAPRREVRINFPRPFSRAPNVVIFISSLDTEHHRQIRLNLDKAGVDTHGFTAILETWAVRVPNQTNPADSANSRLHTPDSIVHNLSATWLAHEADDWTIRSGLLEHPFPGHLSSSQSSWRGFNPPFRRKPKHLFYAFSHIDVHAGANIRLKVECMWDENKVEGIMSTWNDESKFVVLSTSYIALL
ncbi:ATP synthase subunits region orf 7 [Rhypophila decipiens]